MGSHQRTPQCQAGIRVLMNHAEERAIVSDLKVNNSGQYKVWRYKDGYSVLKYCSAVIACYSPITNEVQSTNFINNNMWFRRAIQKYTVLETRD